MATAWKKTGADACRPLALAMQEVRKTGLISQRWLARSLDEALQAHAWEGSDRPYSPGLSKRIARLVYSSKEGSALANALAREIRHERVLVQLVRFFNTTGLAETGLPVDHPGAGRNRLMGAMLGRWMNDRPHAYHTELDRQGCYTLFQSVGPNLVNRSVLCVDALGSDSIIWALHLFRTAGGPPEELQWRAGVFLPHHPPTALLSASRWLDCEPMVRRCFELDAAEQVLASMKRSNGAKAVTEPTISLLTLKAQNEGHQLERGSVQSFGFLKQDPPLTQAALDRIGLLQRDALTRPEEAVTLRLTGEQMQALTEAQDALTRFANIKPDETPHAV